MLSKEDELKQKIDDANVLIEELRVMLQTMADKDVFIGFRLTFREVCKSMVKKIAEYQKNFKRPK